jgi:hypothetical protein
MNPISEALIQDFYTHLRSNNISGAKAVLGMLIGIAAASSQTEKPVVFYTAMDDIQRRLRKADLERRAAEPENELIAGEIR